jgi:hypothetical protein
MRRFVCLERMAAEADASLKVARELVTYLK